MELSDILKPESVLVYLAEGTKEEIIRQLVDVLPLDGCSASRDEVQDAILERENVMSTGIGRGVAIPHAKCEGVDGILAAAGIAEEPLDFDAIDGKPVKVFFLIVSDPRTTSPHIRVLSRISRILNDKARRAALEHAESVEDVLSALDVPEEPSA
ncbi:MAG: PTS sugar transporter subunit IIA [Planctomycetota bacterium]|jgi:mannitol/fructose-specific phosphotransferase system IIA component (Ntr-type)